MRVPPGPVVSVTKNLERAKESSPVDGGTISYFRHHIELGGDRGHDRTGVGPDDTLDTQLKARRDNGQGSRLDERAQRAAGCPVRQCPVVYAVAE